MHNSAAPNGQHGNSASGPACMGLPDTRGHERNKQVSDSTQEQIDMRKSEHNKHAAEPTHTAQSNAHAPEAVREKKRAALSSLLAALLLTALKLIVGIFTNSLGVLAEAAHSALDLLAAGVTFFAIRISSRPADARHAYGHGKVENLAALVETLLLLATCGWIVQEAITRLIHSHEPVKLSIWAILVMVVSIIVDFSRSRMLSRVAKKHKSQALEADALHFSTDMLSSSVVIAGLLAVWCADFFPPQSLAHHALLRADAAAALVVAVIVAWVSLRLGKNAVDTLLDAGGTQHLAQVEAAIAGVPEVLRINSLRLRESGPAVFVDMKLVLPAASSLEHAHSVTEQVEKAVQRILPGADVTIHFEPEESEQGSLMDRVRKTASRHGLDVHAIKLYHTDQGNFMTLHATLDGATPLNAAHPKADLFERDLKASGYEILMHLEPRRDSTHSNQATLLDPDAQPDVRLDAIINRVTAGEPMARGCHKLRLLEANGEKTLSLHCYMPGSIPLEQAHEIITRMEQNIHSLAPEIKNVTIHTDVLEDGQ